jgi:predicted RND superfamily exporter protein
MDKFVDNIIRFRWYIAIIIPLMTVMFATQLKHLEFEGSYRIWFDEDSSILKDYDNFRAVFGNDDGVTIIFKDDDGVFNPKALHVIQRITKKLWETKDIARVDSLINYQYVHTDTQYPDEVIVEDFIEDVDALTLEQLKQKSEDILDEEMILGRIVSKDLKTTMIMARMTPKAGDDPFVSARLKKAVEDIVAAEKDSGYRFYLVGGPILNMAFIDLGQHDATTFTPLVLLIAMILLWIIFRRPSAMLLSISVVFLHF